MSAICTALMATRKRPARMLAAVKTLLETVKSGQIEILIRCDKDDARTLNYSKFVDDIPGVRLIVGDPKPPGARLGYYTTELDLLASTPWVFLVDDDMLFRGSGWVEELELLPNDTFAYVTHYWLNPSFYTSSSPVAPFVPHLWWRDVCKRDYWGDPNDAAVRESLHVQNKWKPSSINNLEVYHDWDPGWQL